MRWYQFLIGLVLTALCALPTSYGQAILDADFAEVHRRGDYVEAFGHGPRSEGEQNYLQAVAKPVDDSHKWFITIITSQNCAPCKKLKSDMRTKPELQAFVNVVTPKQSWAHLNIYSIEDETQSWRWANIKVTSFPTILIQPPINGRYGDPKTIVFQKAGYKGGSSELAKQMSDQLRTYLAKLQTPQPAVRGVAQQHTARTYPYFEPDPTGGAKQLFPWKGPPPFAPPPKVEPAPVTPSPLGPDLNIPDFLNPDSKPVTPVTPTTPTPTLAAAEEKPVAKVVIEGNNAENTLADPRFRKILGRLRAKYANLTVEYTEISKVKDLFPGLTKAELPAVVLTENGVVREAMTNLLLPLLVDLPSPTEIVWYISLLQNGWAFGGTGLGLAAAYIAFRLYRNWRIKQGLPLIISPEQEAMLKQYIESLLSKPKNPA